MFHSVVMKWRYGDAMSSTNRLCQHRRRIRTLTGFHLDYVSILKWLVRNVLVDAQFIGYYYVYILHL